MKSSRAWTGKGSIISASIRVFGKRLQAIQRLGEIDEIVGKKLPGAVKRWGFRRFLPHVRTTTLTFKGENSLNSKRLRRFGGIIPKTCWMGRPPSKKARTGIATQMYALKLYFESPIIFAHWHEKGFVGTQTGILHRPSGTVYDRTYNYPGKKFLSRPLTQRGSDIQDVMARVIHGAVNKKKREMRK